MMKSLLIILLLIIPGIVGAQGIIVDRNSVDEFDRIPPEYAAAAADLRMLFMDRSVGGNIDEYLDCLASSFEDAPSRCKRYMHKDSTYAVDPSEVEWLGTWDRKNWRYEFWPGCSEDAICFIDYIEPRIDSFDVVGFQFSYLAVTPGSKLADPATGFFTPGTDRNTAEAYAVFAARHPSKTVVWWTTSLARSIGTEEATSFNRMMREYALQNNIVLFDVADILSHDPDGNPCFDNRDGVAYQTENNPDDGLDIPAICPQYTTETEGGHLGSIAAGGIRVAKAFWVLMARIAGWQGATSVQRNSTELKMDLVIDLVPNPAQNLLSIQIRSMKTQQIRIRIIDFLGREMSEGFAATIGRGQSGYYRVNTALYPDGLYLLQVMTNRGMSTGKFIVVH